MYHLLVDSCGASLAAFPEREPALRAWRSLLCEDAAPADDMSLLVCDGDGLAVESVAVDALFAV